MKFLHMADLHIGIHVNGFSMLEDQQYALEQILSFIKDEQPEAVIIAGDVYDKPTPSIEAIQVYDHFLTAVSGFNIPLLVISGNHDSPERLGFASRIMMDKHIYTYSVFDGSIHKHSFTDEYGTVHFYLLPFIRPINVRRFFKNTPIDNYQEGIKIVIEAARIDTAQRNVLVAHQFILSAGTEAERSESEIEPIGGLDGVDVQLVAGFDYVALGHLHGPQKVACEHIRYAGSLLKYSSSEWHHQKSVSMVDLGPKGEVTITPLPLVPLREMRKIRGPLEELLKEENARQGNRDDYLLVTLTDEEEPLDALGKVRSTYPNVMALWFDNTKTRTSIEINDIIEMENKSPLQLFENFFKDQIGKDLKEAQIKIVEDFLERTGD